MSVTDSVFYIPKDSVFHYQKVTTSQPQRDILSKIRYQSIIWEGVFLSKGSGPSTPAWHHPTVKSSGSVTSEYLSAQEWDCSSKSLKVSSIYLSLLQFSQVNNPDLSWIHFSLRARSSGYSTCMCTDRETISAQWADSHTHGSPCRTLDSLCSPGGSLFLIGFIV